MDVVVRQLAVLVHPAEGLGAVLDRLPVVADDLVALLGDGILVLPAADVAVEGAGLHPCGFQQWRLGAGGGDDDVGAVDAASPGRSRPDEFHLREDRRHLRDELLFLLGGLGADPAVLELGRAVFIAMRCILACSPAPMNPIDSASSAGEVFRRDSAHRADAHVRAERAFHDGDRKAVFDLRQDDDRREVLDAVLHRVRREHRDPLHAADFLLRGRSRAGS